MSKFSLTKNKALKSETYQSKHLADILDCYEQVMKKFDEQERELDVFVSMQEGQRQENQTVEEPEKLILEGNFPCSETPSTLDPTLHESTWD